MELLRRLRGVWAGDHTAEIAASAKIGSQKFTNTIGPRPRGLLRPDPVFIIGMHRSGTSALGGALEKLGLTVGKSVMPPRPENPMGFAENLSLVKLHDQFLAAFGSKWQDPEPIGYKCFQDNTAGRFRKKLHRLLTKEFGMGRALIKDPRMCRLMPLWLPLIEEHFPRTFFILPIRHPLQVAQSLRHRHGLTLAHGLKLWVVHVLEGERNTRGRPRLFTTYDQLLQFPAATARRLAQCLGLSTEEAVFEIAGQIDSNLRHHKQTSWPAGESHEELTLSIHRALVSGESSREEELDLLRDDYYSQMGWDASGPPPTAPTPFAGERSSSISPGANLSGNSA